LLKKQEHEMSEQISKEQQKQSDIGFKLNQLNSLYQSKEKAWK